MLMIGPMERAAIKNLIFYAENNKFSYAQICKIINRELPPAGDNKNFVITIPLNYRIVFTIEEQKNGWYSHLSISVPTKGKFPSVESVDAICTEFGIKDFGRDNFDGICYLEEDAEAVNVLYRR